MDSKHFLLLSELFDQFRQQALMLLKDAEALGFIDDLTGCYNRKAYDVRKEQLNILPNVSIIFVDVNGLKFVNDISGHKAGDLLLRDLGKMLKAYFGGNDVFRVGGDEFIILKPNIKHEAVEALVNDFQTTINTTHKNSVSIGCTCTLDYENFDTAIKEAEKIMYQEKEKFYNDNPNLKRNLF